MTDPDPATTAAPIDAATDAILAAPYPKWAVPGLIPEGLTLFAGAPKVGKSSAPAYDRDLVKQTVVRMARDGQLDTGEHGRYFTPKPVAVDNSVALLDVSPLSPDDETAGQSR